MEGKSEERRVKNSIDSFKGKKRLTPLEGKSEERRVKNSIDSFKAKKAGAVENSLRPSGYGLAFEFFYLFTFLLFFFNPSNFYKSRYKAKRLKTK